MLTVTRRSLATGCRCAVPPLQVPSDIAIAQSVKPRPIYDVAAALGLDWKTDLDLYGAHKAKVEWEAQRERGEGADRIGAAASRLSRRLTASLSYRCVSLFRFTPTS